MAPSRSRAGLPVYMGASLAPVYHAEAHRIVHIGTAARPVVPRGCRNGCTPSGARPAAVILGRPSGPQPGKYRYPAPAGATAPAARPDSTQIAARRARAASRVGSEVWAHGPLGQPSWSPFGKQIAFRLRLTISTSRQARPAVTRVLGTQSPPGDPVWSFPPGLAFAAGSEVLPSRTGAALGLHRGAQPSRRRPARLVARRQAGRLLVAWRRRRDHPPWPRVAHRLVDGCRTAYTAMGDPGEYSGSRSAVPGPPRDRDRRVCSSPP